MIQGTKKCAWTLFCRSWYDNLTTVYAQKYIITLFCFTWITGVYESKILGGRLVSVHNLIAD